MKLVKTERTFVLDNGDIAFLRVHQISPPNGVVWPGCDRVLRVWSINRKSEGSSIVRCTAYEMRELEEKLGEITTLAFHTHPTIGLVVYDAADDDVPKKESEQPVEPLDMTK